LSTRKRLAIMLSSGVLLCSIAVIFIFTLQPDTSMPEKKSPTAQGPTTEEPGTSSPPKKPYLKLMTSPAVSSKSG